MAIVALLIAIDGDPIDPTGVAIGVGFLAASIAVGVLLARFDRRGRMSRALDVVAAVGGLGFAVYGAISLLGGGDAAPLVLGLLVGGAAASRLLRRA